ncbi:MAG TPA: PQQ-binding-like beta-propeller repeat protein, partial [Candidatus Polarisedimenticolia bacterium]|nr:PQQ-binding-like beta-propeller repeat protein [Candidatus Polarisedimenticolia bacterium]
MWIRTIEQTRRGTAVPRPGCGAARLLLLAIVLLACIVPAAAREQKTVFRSQSGEVEPRLEKRDTLPNLQFAPAWTFKGFGAPLAGDPVVCGGRLVVASQNGDVAGLDPSDGRVAWSVTLSAALSVGPSTDGSAIYQGSQDGRLFAVRDGIVLWTTTIGSAPAFPPRPMGGRLYVAVAAQELLSVDPGDGRIETRRALPGRPSTPPEPAPGSVLIGTEHGMVLCLTVPGLAVRWRYYAGQAITAPPLYYKRKVYLAALDRSLMALRFRNGHRLWRYDTGAITTARLFVRRPYLYALCYDNDIYILRARNGHLVHRARLGHRLDASAARSDHHLFVAPFTEASLVGLSLPGLRTLGRFALEVPGEWFTTAPVLVAGRVALGYGRAEGRVLALTVSEVTPKEP